MIDKETPLQLIYKMLEVLPPNEFVNFIKSGKDYLFTKEEEMRHGDYIDGQYKEIRKRWVIEKTFNHYLFPFSFWWNKPKYNPFKNGIWGFREVAANAIISGLLIGAGLLAVVDYYICLCP